MPFPNLDGREPIEFTDSDWQQIESMCAIHCTGEEIASIMRVSYDTLERRVKEKYQISFADYFKQRSANGKMSLRRRQYTMAMDGNATLQIWLGKQWLGQTETIQHGGQVKFELAYNPDNIDPDTE